MTYSLDEKTAAVERGELWWRFPTSRDAHSREWSLLSDDLSQPYDEDLQLEDDRIPAEYHIGPTAPVVLTELERELLDALKAVRRSLSIANDTPDGPIRDTIWNGPGETLFDFIDTTIAKATGGAA
ncbi:hypothetical protein [Aquabacterium sp.]|uniref:hypothetical protein n=1 Tax=Aquabacterium sp. TaxID=1872578 RepID=UPI0035B2571D